MGTDVRRTDTMFIAPQRSCSGLQWSKTEWCVYLYSNCRKWPQVLQECDIITFGWFNCWRQHLHPDTVLYHTSRHNLLHVSLSACWKTGQNPCKNTHGENCMAQVGCWYFVRLCGAAGAGGEVSDEKKQSKHIHILTALFTTRIHKENKQVLPYQPTSEKLWPNNLLHVSLSACWKTGQNPCKNTHDENCIAQVGCWYFVRLCGAACWLRSEWWKINIQTYPYSNCTFHQENSQRVQTSFTVPTNLGKTLANIIHCMCLFQHGKQERNYARTSMVKIALRKLVAGILCGCVVLLVGCEVSGGKNHPNLSIF